MPPPSPKAPGEALLLARARQGDAQAQQTLFDAHRRTLEARIRRFLPRPVRRRVSVADVLQETRIVAFSSAAQFEAGGGGGYRAWLLAIAERKAREALRAHVGTAKRAVGREVSGADDRPGRRPRGAGATPSEAAMASERLEAVRRTLAALAPDDREVLRLVRLEGLALSEAATRLSRSLEATKKLYGRALLRFGKAFGRDPEGRA